VANRSAVARVGVARAAAAFCELVRRYPGGLVPVDFVRNYLFDAAPEAPRPAPPVPPTCAPTVASARGPALAGA